MAALLVLLLLPGTFGPALENCLPAFSSEQVVGYDSSVPPDWMMPETNDWVPTELADEAGITVPLATNDPMIRLLLLVDDSRAPAPVLGQLMVNSQFYVSSL